MSNLGQHRSTHDQPSNMPAKRKASRCCSSHLPDPQLQKFQFDPPTTSKLEGLVEDTQTLVAERSVSPDSQPASSPSPSPSPFMDVDDHSVIHRLTEQGRFKAEQASHALQHAEWETTKAPPTDTCDIEYPQRKRAKYLDLQEKHKALSAPSLPPSADYSSNSPPQGASTPFINTTTRIPHPRGVSLVSKIKTASVPLVHHQPSHLFLSSRSRLFKPTFSNSRRRLHHLPTQRATTLPPDFGHSPPDDTYEPNDNDHPHGPFWYKLRMTPSSTSTSPTTNPGATTSQTAGLPTHGAAPSNPGESMSDVNTNAQQMNIDLGLGARSSGEATGSASSSLSGSSHAPSPVASSSPMGYDESRPHHIRLPLPTMPSNSYYPSSNTPAPQPTPSTSTRTSAPQSSSPSASSSSSPFGRIMLPQVSIRLPNSGSTSSSCSSSAATSPATPPPHVPSVYPLINRDTLRELDLEVILRSPQLRHDLLFDPGLQFRPTSGRRKRDATEKYWEAIGREMEWGCTCACFDERGRVHACVCGKVPPGALLPGSAFKPSSSQVHAGFAPALRATPSRILPLLTTLRDVLGLVIQPSSASSQSQHAAPSSQDPASPPLTPNSATSFDAAPSSPSSASDPLANSVLASLDPALIEQEIRHGVFDYRGVFKWVGEVMKMHCAPMRDGMVENMVRVATGGVGTGSSEAVRGLRMCFEILEVMKLDIANHQLQALRPYLLETSSEFELKTFQERYEKGMAGLSVAQRWMSDAAQTIKPATVTNAAGRIDKPKLVTTALCTAMVDLVFKPPLPSSPTATSPTTTSSHSSRSHRNAPSLADSGFPETLYLDHARLNSYINDTSDLLGLYMLVMLFKQLTSSPSSPVSLEDWEIDRIKREVWEVGPSRLGMCFDVCLTSGSTGSPAEVENKWNKGMNDVMLQVGMRAEEAREKKVRPGPVEAMVTDDAPATTTTKAALQPPKPETQTLIQNWMRSNYRKDSPLQKIMKDRLRNAVLDVVKDNVLAASADGFTSAARLSAGASSKMRKLNGLRKPTASTGTGSVGNGLEPLMPEILHLGERIARLVMFHARVYRRLYEVEGFLQA